MHHKRYNSQNPQIIYSMSHCRMKQICATVVVSAADLPPLKISPWRSSMNLCPWKDQRSIIRVPMSGAVPDRMHRQQEACSCTNHNFHTLKFPSVRPRTCWVMKKKQSCWQATEHYYASFTNCFLKGLVQPTHKKKGLPPWPNHAERCRVMCQPSTTATNTATILTEWRRNKLRLWMKKIYI